MAAQRSPRLRWWGVVCVPLLAVGCGPGLAYHLHLDSLIPPRVAAVPAPVRLRLHCPGGAERRSLSWGGAGGGLQWSVSRGGLEAQLYPTIGRLNDMMPPALERGVEGLRAQLDQEVAAGCISADSRAAFLRQLVEGLTLNSGLAQKIVLGPYFSEDYIDIGGPVELYLAYPLAPAHPGDYSHGYVERTIHLVATGSGGRGRLVAGRPHAVGAAVPNELPTPPFKVHEADPSRLVRLFFVVRYEVQESGGGRDHNAALLTAETQVELARASARLARDPAACAQLDIAGATCQPVPLAVELEARVKVQVDGRDVAVPLPATVAMALGNDSPGDLRVYRDYKGRLVPVSADGGTAALMNLRLIGGEQIFTRK